MVKTILICILAFLLVGCLTSDDYGEAAQRTASVEHNCPKKDVKVSSIYEMRGGGYLVELIVCGKRARYLCTAETTAFFGCRDNIRNCLELKKT